MDSRVCPVPGTRKLNRRSQSYRWELRKYKDRADRPGRLTPGLVTNNSELFTKARGRRQPPLKRKECSVWQREVGAIKAHRPAASCWRRCQSEICSAQQMPQLRDAPGPLLAHGCHRQISELQLRGGHPLAQEFFTLISGPFCFCFFVLFFL